ncbi:MAG: bacteriophage abortive infection AbiH family protein [Muribaculaceae bacterium]|nr:bacteriophage abortive infection AbiH family protein [Muribaculaceae bacterium]
MNRIILIGNGFDLAHGLPTRYEDFINWYWNLWGKKLSTSKKLSEYDHFYSFVLKDMRYNWAQTWKAHNQSRPSLNNILEKIKIIKEGRFCDIIEKSKLFPYICQAIEVKGWVDIEKEYYDLLREVALKPEGCDYTITELNRDLDYVQELLTQYLTSITNREIECNVRIRSCIYESICKNDISVSQLPTYHRYIYYLINHIDDEYRIILKGYGLEDSDIQYVCQKLKELQQYTKRDEIEEIQLQNLIRPAHIMLLNFNYTGVADQYRLDRVSTVNHIHGELSNLDSIIFGYGDELDDDYKNLLKLTGNDSLNNIKSIKYLESNHYRNLLHFIESDPYQVYIMGHSCGNSDRTLLNTLFEHKNCVSIKPFYYQKRDGSDNYMEIIQNICRNFTDMKLMRDRVVNKTFCKPLPQVSK